MLQHAVDRTRCALLQGRSRIKALLDAKVERVRAVAQPGSALRSGRRGREFKSPQPDFLSMRFILSLTACIALVAIGCGGSDDASGDSGGSQPNATVSAPALHLRRIATFESPVYLTSPPGDKRRIFVVEQAGTIRMLRDGGKVQKPFIYISSQVESGGERGLLSMAFAPDYAKSHEFYVYYTG